MSGLTNYPGSEEVRSIHEENRDRTGAMSLAGEACRSTSIAETMLTAFADIPDHRHATGSPDV